MEEALPHNARYTYPTMANYSTKSLMKIPPKNGQTLSSAGGTNPTCTIEFPAAGYLNTRNSFLSFDLVLFVDDAKNVRVQNNIASIFKRGRFNYGSLPLEDIREMNVLVRMLTEGAGTATTGIVDQTAINEGIGGAHTVVTSTGTANHLAWMNTRLNDIQSGGLDVRDLTPAGAINSEPNTPRARRYQIQLPFGLLQQNKLLPLKWMGSQVSIELDLATWAECMTMEAGTYGTYSKNYYELRNVTFDAEILEFDGTYDAAILEGLRGPGVPIRFASWNTYFHQPYAAQSQTINIPERNRSLKAIFNVQLPPPMPMGSDHAVAAADKYNIHSEPPVGDYAAVKVPWDSHAFLQSSSNLNLWEGSSNGFLQNFQWRIGGKYYPAQPVNCGSNTESNGAGEAYTEFAKALNIVGDYRLSTGIHPTRWTRCNGGTSVTSSMVDWISDISKQTATNPMFGTACHDGPSCFVTAVQLETSTGDQLSGLNGEEQNDIALLLNYNKEQTPTALYRTFVYYDAMLILRENNAVELIK